MMRGQPMGMSKYSQSDESKIAFYSAFLRRRLCWWHSCGWIVMFLLWTGNICTNTCLYFAILSPVLLWFPALSLTPPHTHTHTLPKYPSIAPFQIRWCRHAGHSQCCPKKDIYNFIKTATPNTQSAEKDLKEMMGEIFRHIKKARKTFNCAVMAVICNTRSVDHSGNKNKNKNPLFSQA